MTLRKVMWILGFPIRCVVYAVAWGCTRTFLGDLGEGELIKMKKEWFTR